MLRSLRNYRRCQTPVVCRQNTKPLPVNPHKQEIYSLMERYVIGSYNYISAYRDNDEKAKKENESFIINSTDKLSDILGSDELKELFRKRFELARQVIIGTINDDPNLPDYKEKIVMNSILLAVALNRINNKYSVDEWNNQIKESFGLLGSIKDIVSPDVDTLPILYKTLERVVGLSRMMS